MYVSCCLRWRSCLKTKFVGYKFSYECHGTSLFQTSPSYSVPYSHSEIVSLSLRLTDYYPGTSDIFFTATVHDLLLLGGFIQQWSGYTHSVICLGCERTSGARESCARQVAAASLCCVLFRDRTLTALHANQDAALSAVGAGGASEQLYWTR